MTLKLLHDKEMQAGRVRRASPEEMLELLAAEMRAVTLRFEKRGEINANSLRDLAEMQDIIFCLQENASITMKELQREIRNIHQDTGSYQQRWVLME